jgi:hypothetical protein
MLIKVLATKEVQSHTSPEPSLLIVELVIENLINHKAPR